MAYSRTTDRYVDASTWLSLGGLTVETVFALTILAGTASLFAASIGDLEMVALIGVSTIAVILLGLALTRAFEYLEYNGLPVIEDGSARCRQMR